MPMKSVWISTNEGTIILPCGYPQSYQQCFQRFFNTFSTRSVIVSGLMLRIQAKSLRMQGLLPYMLQGRQLRFICTMFSGFCPHPKNPAYGCVAPQTLTTGVFVSDAKCIFALSMLTIQSRWLIRISS